MRTYRSEFPDFRMDVAIPADWRDESWHNDACPSFSVPGTTLVVFVDYAARQHRDIPYAARFQIVNQVNDDASPDYGTLTLVESDEWLDVLAFVARRRFPPAAAGGRPVRLRTPLADGTVGPFRVLLVSSTGQLVCEHVSDIHGAGALFFFDQDQLVLA